MKTKILTVITMMALALISCNEIQVDPLAESQTERRINIDQALIEHSWAVNLFWDAGTDATAELSRYIIEFREDGSIKASDGTNTVDGEWYTAREASKIMMSVKFIADGIFGDMTHVWTVAHFPFRDDRVLRLEYFVTDKRDSYVLELEAR